jgi:hypothetical protein
LWRLCRLRPCSMQVSLSISFHEDGSYTDYITTRSQSQGAESQGCICRLGQAFWSRGFSRAPGIVEHPKPAEASTPTRHVRPTVSLCPKIQMRPNPRSLARNSVSSPRVHRREELPGCDPAGAAKRRVLACRDDEGHLRWRVKRCSAMGSPTSGSRVNEAGPVPCCAVRSPVVRRPCPRQNQPSSL